MLTKLPITLPFVTSALQGVPVLATNFGFILMVILLSYYTILNVTIGALMSIQFVTFYMLSNFLEQSVIKAGQFWVVCILIQVFGWGIQFVGHGVFEGRRPALLDNLLQVFIAPIFVMLEYLFMLGICKDLEVEINRKIKEREQQHRNK